MRLIITNYTQTGYHLHKRRNRGVVLAKRAKARAVAIIVSRDPPLPIVIRLGLVKGLARMTSGQGILDPLPIHYTHWVGKERVGEVFGFLH